jgi:hypothetical protein
MKSILFLTLPILIILTQGCKRAQPQMNHEIAVERIQKVAKLITVQSLISDIYDYKDLDPKQWAITRNIFPKERGCILISKAWISAGFDLHEHLTIDVSEPTKKVTITLPPPKIIATDPTLRFYTMTGNGDAEFSNQVIAEAKNALNAAALHSGILDKARESARQQITAFFPDYADYTIDVLFTDDNSALTQPPKL